MESMSKNPNDYPIYQGPLYMCCHCQTMYISEEFLNKHRKKCIQMNILSILKFQLNRNALNKDFVKYDSENKNKRARGKARSWTKIQVFEEASEAELYVKTARVWSKASTKQSHSGERVEFRCKKGKYREQECPYAIYLLYHSNDRKVSLFSTNSEHNHQHVKSTYGMNKETQEFVIDLVQKGVDKPNAIIAAFKGSNLLEPSKSKLINFLRRLRRQLD